MVSQTVTIINPTGLHMRPAGLFASTMGKFSSNVTIKGNGKEINGKSPMAIMAGGTHVEAGGVDDGDSLRNHVPSPLLNACLPAPLGTPGRGHPSPFYRVDCTSELKTVWAERRYASLSSSVSTTSTTSSPAWAFSSARRCLSEE